MRLPAEKQQMLVSLPLFIEAFFAYVSLLKDDLPPHCCDICGANPMAIICDATGYKVFDHLLRECYSFGHPTAAAVQGQRRPTPQVRPTSLLPADE